MPRFAPRTLCFFICILVGTTARANNTEGLMTLDQAGTGSLMIKSTIPGEYVPAPALGTDVQMTITGTINRTMVTQKFQNPSDQWVEAMYAFPLPEGAAVDVLKMVVGERIIEGKIREKEDARKIFDQAKQNGQKASLVEQLRPNMFTNEVANIGPHETIIVQIEYQETVRIVDGDWSVRFPMVIGARYNPQAPIIPDEPGETVHKLADPVPERDKIPDHQRYDATLTNPLTLQARLNAGMTLQKIETPFHRTDVVDEDGGHYLVTLAKGNTSANRDFEMIWSPLADQAPAVTAYAEGSNEGDYVLVTLTPPVVTSQLDVDRELVLVIDVSGSMSGTSIGQAKASALAALARLGPNDSVNVISFSSDYATLFPKAQSVTPSTRHHARSFINNLHADGGTEMYPALHAALVNTRESGSEKLRQIVFMTDGSVGNEDQLFALIHTELGVSRLFTVGIGSAPNAHFMTRAANMGRGTYTYIGSTAQIASRMSALFNKLEQPAMTDISVRWPSGIDSDLAQEIVPDLYAGEPIVLAARVSSLTGDLTLQGNRSGALWQTSVSLDKIKKTSGPGIGKLWARHKIADLEAAILRGKDRDQAQHDITLLALGHHLVSRFTSLVAVDTTPARPEGQPLVHKDIPLMVPEGWDMFAQPTALHPKATPMPQLMAMIAPQQPAQINSLVLPKTATGLQASLIMGVLLIMAGLLFVLFTRRRNPVLAGMPRAHRW
jgi:Ca-activated chloride channel family protein